MKIKLQNRYRHIVGKNIGGHVYVHRMYVNDIFPELTDVIDEIHDVNFNLLKIPTNDDDRKEYIFLVNCKDFDHVNEPRVGTIYKYEFGTGIVHVKDYSFFVYHHKWLWVKDDYTGFNVKKAIERSITWRKLNPPSSSIGSYRFWSLWLKKHGLPI